MFSNGFEGIDCGGDLDILPNVSFTVGIYAKHLRGSEYAFLYYDYCVLLIQKFDQPFILLGDLYLRRLSIFYDLEG